MTPSGWHDDARNRDAGHDDMQIGVYDYLRDNQLNLEGLSGFKRQGVWFEYPFKRRSQVIAWGDIVEVWDDTDQYSTSQHYVVWEIKPKIHSVGAVVRQCKATSIAAAATLIGRNGRPNGVTVIPVVRSDDPKISALRHVFQVVTWDGSTMS